jgi:outer membrane protein assembly factor BamE (lipoprotein component of BamABCDE complex)
VRILPLFLALALAACGAATIHAGRDFDVPAIAAKLHRGATTQDELRAWLGAPNSTGISVETSGETLTQWTYFFAEGDLSGLSDTRIKMLQIKFDQKGIAQAFNWSNSAR